MVSELQVQAVEVQLILKNEVLWQEGLGHFLFQVWKDITRISPRSSLFHHGVDLPFRGYPYGVDYLYI